MNIAKWIFRGLESASDSRLVDPVMIFLMAQILLEDLQILLIVERGSIQSLVLDEVQRR